MRTHSARLSLMGVICTLLPLTSTPAGTPAADPAKRLEQLLTVHDVRHAIHALRAGPSECLHTEAERGR
jgi:hypothetical protein